MALPQFFRQKYKYFQRTRSYLCGSVEGFTPLPSEEVESTRKDTVRVNVHRRLRAP